MVRASTQSDALQANNEYRLFSKDISVFRAIYYDGLHSTVLTLSICEDLFSNEASASGESAATCDPWRMTVNVTLLGQTGFEVEQQLQADYDVYPELATQQVHHTMVSPALKDTSIP